MTGLWVAGRMVLEDTMTSTAECTERFANAQAIWDEYQRSHDVTGLKGCVAAVNMDTGEVLLRPTACGLPGGADAAGCVPHYALFRIGQEYYSGYPAPRLRNRRSK
jgi:hypothetical protein